MSVTTRRAAFEKGGYPNGREYWPSDELLEIAINAIAKCGNDTDACQHAIFRACRNDPALLRSLIAPWWRQATASIITEARDEVEARERRGELLTARERRAAIVIEAERKRELRREQAELEEQRRLQAEADAEYREWRDQWLATKARFFYIEDRPFWEVSTRNAREWQRRQEHRAKFLDLVLSGVPEDDRPIMHYRRPDEVDALWDQAYE